LRKKERALKKAKIRQINSKAIISHSDEFNPVYDYSIAHPEERGLEYVLEGLFS